MKTSKQIVFTKVNTAELIDMQLPELMENEVLVETKISTISNGTEKANIMGDENVSVFEAPEEQAVFPRYCGYSSSGVVINIGEKVKNVKIGDRVVVYWGKHSKYNVVPETQVVKIDNDDISFEEAALTFISTFPMAAVRKTEIELGESAIVMGLGPLGLLAVQILRMAGAVPVIAVDPVKGRREAALKFGADYAIDPTEKNYEQVIKQITNGGANVAIESTGLGIGLKQALDCMARFGRISMLGCTRDSNFQIDYYRKVHGPGIKIIGAHTSARPIVESYPGYYTHADDIKAALKLCAGKRFNLKEMISEVHSPKECGEVFDRLVNDKEFPHVVQFDWKDI